VLAAAAVALAGACDRRETIVVLNAGSLARPLKAVLDTFARREGVRIAQQSAGSLEAARRVTDLGHRPDVIALADAEVFDELLMPGFVERYAIFARNRMVIAYGPRSLGRERIGTSPWFEIVTAPGVVVGRSDPLQDPAGYRALLVMRMAEIGSGVDGLAVRLEAAAPSRAVRPKSAELIALLQAGELDYVWIYESSAQAVGLDYIRLPQGLDLAGPEIPAEYRDIRVTLRGAGSGGAPLIVQPMPIAYAVAIPRDAPHPALARRFIAFLVSDEGRAILRAESLDALESPVEVEGP